MHPLLPEALLLGLVFLLAALDGGLFPRRRGRGSAHAGFIGLLLPLTAALALWGRHAASDVPVLAADPFYETWRVLLLTLGVLLAALDAGGRPGSDDGASTSLLLLAVLAGLVTVASRHLAVTVGSMEIGSLALLARSVRRAEEPLPHLSRWVTAHLLATTLLVLACALLAHNAGSLAYDDLRRAGSGATGTAGGLLLLAGVALRMAAAPFHGWLPPLSRRLGVEFAPIVCLGILPILAALARLARDPFQGHDPFEAAIIVSGLLGITVGNLLALVQHDLRRLLGYGLLVHLSYGLLAVGLSTASDPHLLHVVVFGFALVGLTAATDFRAGQITAAGLAARRPVLAAAVCACMLNLAGLPPSLGFVARSRLLGDVARVDETLFLFVGANAMLTAWAFLVASVRVLFAPPMPQPPAAARPERTAALVLAAIGLVACGLWPAPLVDLLAGCEILP